LKSKQSFVNSDSFWLTIDLKRLIFFSYGFSLIDRSGQQKGWETIEIEPSSRMS